MSTKPLNFSDLGGPVYVGRDRGEAARVKWKLDDADARDERFVVTIPDGTFSINSSFFLGLFGKSIKKAGSREAFLSRYQFVGEARFREKIDEAIERALFEGKTLLLKET